MVNDVLTRLEGVQRTRDGWSARCPAHDDGHPSLSVGEGRDGRVLVYCHAGCSTDEIVQALGLDLSDLGPENGAGPGYTLADYADEKNLPAGELRSWGVRTVDGKKGPVVAIPYRDAQGETDGVKLRAGDLFWWDEHSKLPYGLDRLNGAKSERAVLLLEGESDCHTAWHHGLLAVGVPGANSWRSSWAGFVQGRDVYVWREPDQGGEEFVAAVTADLPDARVIEAPDDAEDLFALHQRNRDGFRPRLAELIEDAEAVSVETWAEMGADRDEAAENEAPDSQKARLLALTADLDVFSSERDVAYAHIRQGGHRETWPVSSSRFRAWLARAYYQRYEEAPTSSTVQDVLQVVEGRARFDGPARELANRFAKHQDGLWYDLADEAWRAVRIDGDGWTVVDDPPPLFRRYAHQEAQVDPEPTDAEALPELLGPFANVADEGDKLLLDVWLAAAPFPDVPRPPLIPHGPQGSAKTFLTLILRQLIDPSATPMPRFPRGDAEMAQVLDHHAAPFFDNISRLSGRDSDTLCRAVTGDGFTKRKLYSDDEDVLYSFRRVLLLNGINVPAQRPDLLDRSLLLRLERLPEEDRRPERDLRAEFARRRPKMVGAMFDALSRAIARGPADLNRLPRMADWTRWGYTLAEVIGHGGREFMTAYAANRDEQNLEALGSHPVGAAVRAFMKDRAHWTGSPSDLLTRLERVAEEESIDTSADLWPGAANWVRRRMNEVSANLREAGIEYSAARDDDKRHLELRRRGGGESPETPVNPETGNAVSSRTPTNPAMEDAVSAVSDEGHDGTDDGTEEMPSAQDHSEHYDNDSMTAMTASSKPSISTPDEDDSGREMYGDEISDPDDAEAF